MVAGDHDGLDAGLAADGHGFLGFRPGRVNHAHKAQESELFFDGFRGGVFRDFVQFTIAHRQHAQGIFAHTVDDFFCFFQIALYAAAGHHVKGTLYDGDGFAVYGIDGGHQFPVRVKGKGQGTGVLIIDLFLFHAVHMSGVDDGGFSGIADVLHVFTVDYDGSVAAKGTVEQQLFYGIAVVIADFFGILHAIHPGLGKGHAVLGEGAGFIGADNGSTAQCFHRRQTADEGIFLYHPLHADGKHDGHNGRQAFGNGGNGKGHGGHEDFQHRNAGGEAHNKDDGAGQQCHKAQVFAQLGQLLLQGRLGIGFTFQKICDFAHFGIHAGGAYHGGTGAVGDGAAGKDHIGPVTDGGFIGQRGIGILFSRNGFAGQGAFFAFEAAALKQAGIGRHKIAGFQADDIAGHQQTGINDAFFSVPNHPCMGGRQVFQCIQRFFGLAFLHHAHDGVEDDDQKNQCGFKKLAPVFLCNHHRKGNDGGGNKDENHHILELIQKTLEHGFFFASCSLLGPCFSRRAFAS